MSHTNYLKLLDKSEIFVAPRKQEGIGISIVEAISKGLYIIGYNDATMNEYIKNDKIGYLFNKQNRKKINTQKILNNFSYRKKHSLKMYNIWQIQQKKILDLYDEKNIYVKKIHFIPLFFLDDLKFIIKKFLNLNFYYRI